MTFDGIDGDLAGTATQAGAVTLQSINPHGDIIAFAPDAASATGTSSYYESTEYGQPRNAGSEYSTYGWLGGHQRSTNDLAGRTPMGVRPYSPIVGRFMSVDPTRGVTRTRTTILWTQ